EEQPRNRRRVEVILAQPATSSDDKLKRKSTVSEQIPVDKVNLQEILNASRAEQRVNLGQDDLHNQLNANSDDLQISLNRQKDSGLRRRLEISKSSKPSEAKGPLPEGSSNDLRTQMRSKRIEKRLQLNVIMGGSPPCGDSVRSVKDYRRKETTSQKWPVRPENDQQIKFSADDAVAVHMPHNDPLLVKLGIKNCKVTKVLVDTGSSVDLIFCDTLDKMGIDPHDMRPSSRSLTSFNGSSETMLSVRVRG
ncbi:hypothetical protein N665_0464s0003, partial [Sinapis alba]